MQGPSGQHAPRESIPRSHPTSRSEGTSYVNVQHGRRGSSPYQNSPRHSHHRSSSPPRSHSRTRSSGYIHSDYSDTNAPAGISSSGGGGSSAIARSLRVTDFPVVQYALLNLKNNTANVELRLVGGKDSLLRSLPVPPYLIDIKQRMRLDQIDPKFETNVDVCILLANAINAGDSVLGQHFVGYLKSKEALGLYTTMDGVTIYIFGSCAFAERRLAAEAPGINATEALMDRLMLMLISNGKP